MIKEKVWSIILVLFSVAALILGWALLPLYYGEIGRLGAITILFFLIAAIGLLVYYCTPEKHQEKISLLKQICNICLWTWLGFFVLLALIYSCTSWSESIANRYRQPATKTISSDTAIPAKPAVNPQKSTAPVQQTITGNKEVYVNSTVTKTHTSPPKQSQQSYTPPPAAKKSTASSTASTQKKSDGYWKNMWYSFFTPGKGHRMYRAYIVNGQVIKKFDYWNPIRYHLEPGETIVIPQKPASPPKPACPPPTPKTPVFDQKAVDDAKTIVEAQEILDAPNKEVMAENPKILYDDNAHHTLTYTTTFSVSAGERGIIGGVRVKIINNSTNKVIFDNTPDEKYAGALIKLLPGSYTITVTDGFWLSINTGSSASEFTARKNQAEIKHWAMYYVIEDAIS